MFQTLGMFGGGIPIPPDATYITTLLDAASVSAGGSYNWNSVDVSVAPPHANRIFVLGWQQVTGGTGVLKVNTVAATEIDRQQIGGGGNPFGVLSQISVPSGNTIDVQVPVASSGETGMAVVLFAIYPASPTAVDHVSSTIASGSTLVANDLATSAGGCVIAYMLSTLTGFTGTWAWSGGGTLAENYENNNFDASMSIGAANIAQTTVGTTFDITYNSDTGSGARGIIAASWGPQA